MRMVRTLYRPVFFLLCFSMIVLLAAGAVLAAEPDSDNGTATADGQSDGPIEEKLELRSPYPILKEKAGRLFEFQVELHYTGTKPRVFDLSIISTSGAYVDIIAPFTTDKGIESIMVEPNQEFPETVKVRYNPAVSGQRDPGEYMITFRAASGDIADTIDLTAVVTASYGVYLTTPSGRLNAEVTAGKDNSIGVHVRNTGASPLEELRLTANVPQGWRVDFVPESIPILNAGVTQEAQMILTPADNTIAGDYEITVMAINSEAVSEMDLRITVATPAIWGWIGVILAALVIIGLAVIFLRLGRR